MRQQDVQEGHMLWCVFLCGLAGRRVPEEGAAIAKQDVVAVL